MRKSVTFGAAVKKATGGADDLDRFVRSGAVEDEPKARVTFEMAESLNRAFKVHCATNGLKMSDVLRDYVTSLIQKNPNL